jgi:hypothetical protein
MPCKVTDVCVCAAICNRLEIQVHQFPDAITGVVSGRVRAAKFVIECIVALPREHRAYAFTHTRLIAVRIRILSSTKT